jgi:chorismate dehydratase
MSFIRCGVVEYLNAVPLWQALRGDARFRLSTGVPSQIASMMASGQLELGLLPVVEYFRTDDTMIVPGVGVCSDGRVDSVRLFHRKPLSEVRSVRLDANSRTSAALAQIVLHDFHKVRPVYSTGMTSPQDLAHMKEDAVLMIGDPCMVAAQQNLVPSTDLGEEWRRCTSLPFVYAAWIARKGPRVPGQTHWLSGDSGEGLRMALDGAMKAGKAALSQIAATGAAAKNMNPMDVEIYLRTKIRYRLEAAELEGLRVFSSRAAALGLCKKRELQLVGQHEP